MIILSKAQFVFRIAAIFFMIELIIMLLLSFFFIGYSPLIETLIDVSLLTTCATPLVYILVIKPYIFAINQLLEQMKQQALTDDLTLLANRRACLGHIKQLISYSGRHHMHSAILYIDLDHFKKINDAFGHLAGDAVLLEIAARLQNNLRNEDYVCRVGGDEFVASLPAIDVSAKVAMNIVKAMSDRLINALTMPIPYGNTSLKVGASIGVRIVTPNCQSVDEILSDADSAMYIAKGSSTHKIHFFERGS